MKKLFVVGIVVLSMISLLGYGIYWAFYDIQRIKGQEVIQEASSPNGTYTVTAYLNNGGATTDYAVLCTVKNNRTGKEKNLYWQYHCDKVDVAWLDEQNVRINGVELNVKTDTYDYRHDN
jgi:hypothetical protein